MRYLAAALCVLMTACGAVQSSPPADQKSPAGVSDVDDLKLRVSALEEGLGTRAKVASVSFTEKGFGVATDSSGFMSIVVAKTAEPYLDGMKLHFIIVNASSLVMNDADIRVGVGPWGARKFKEETTLGEFLPGLGRLVDITVSQAKPSEIENVTLEVEYKAAKWHGAS